MNIVPSSYRLIIYLSDDPEQFTGICELQGNLENPNDKCISLHANNLQIESIKQRKCICKWEKKDNDTIKIHLKEVLNPISLTINYIGKINTYPYGIYHDGKNIATQLQPTFARKCFPCVDDPAFKSKFQLVLVTKPDYVCLSNTSVRNTIIKNSYKITKFEKSPIMSSYLLAFHVSKNICIETTIDDIKIRFHAEHELEQLQFAMDICKDFILYAHQYLSYRYPLGKIDFVELKKMFSAGMENFGLVTMQSDVLRCPSNMHINDKIDIAYVVCHELAHQWFGNLLTTNKWEEIWLNEGFASWFGWFGLKNIRPDWPIPERFFMDSFIKATESDAMLTTRPLLFRGTLEPSNLFDDITYAKGAVIINMIYNYLGDNVFQNAIRQLVSKYAYKSITTVDLVRTLEEVSEKKLGVTLRPWIAQFGYPIISHRIINRFSFIQKINDKEVEKLLQEEFCRPFLIEGVMDLVDVNDPFSLFVTDRKTVEKQIKNYNLEGIHADAVILFTLRSITNIFLLLKSAQIRPSHYLIFLKKILDTYGNNDSDSIVQLVYTHYTYLKDIMSTHDKTCHDSHAKQVEHKFTLYLQKIFLRFLRKIIQKIKTDNINPTTNQKENRSHENRSHNKYVNLFYELHDSETVKYIKGKTYELLSQADANKYLKDTHKTFILSVYKEIAINHPEFILKLLTEDGQDTENREILRHFYKTMHLITDEKTYTQLLLTFLNEGGRRNNILLQYASRNPYFYKQYWRFIRDSWNKIVEIYTLDDKMSINHVLRHLGNLRDLQLVTEIVNHFQNKNILYKHIVENIYINHHLHEFILVGL